jgi:imidazolonepropionase
MSRTLLTNIGQLVTNDPTHDGTPLGLINDAALLIEGEVISWVGAHTDAPVSDVEQQVDVQGQALIPGFVDSHNHLVFAGDRSFEFAERMQGRKYAAGGINYTVEQTRAATAQELRSNTARLVAQALYSGTTTLEIKSGYGLNIATEQLSLEIAREFTDEVTYLGAHIVPKEFANAPEEYLALVTGEMTTMAAPLAKWIDVFCDRGAFTPEQTTRILQAGIAQGLAPRLHANQLEHGEGISLGVEFDAASVDHISLFDDRDIALLSGSNTVATFLPGAEFSTRSPYPDARRMLEAGVTVALATDCNPGSSYTNSMPFMVALAVRDLYFTPEQALWSATAGGAAALRRSDIGRLAAGMRADFSILSAPSYIHLAYRPGVQQIEQVWRNGTRTI